jgi:hypothetical protein
VTSRTARPVFAGEHREHPIRRDVRHDLGPLGPGVDVAVVAGLVAELAHVHLEGGGLLSPELAQPRVSEGRVEVD